MSEQWNLIETCGPPFHRDRPIDILRPEWEKPEQTTWATIPPEFNVCGLKWRYAVTLPE